MELEFFKVEASIGFIKNGIGAYWVGIEGKNKALNLFGKQVEMSFGFNIGVGAHIEVGKNQHSVFQQDLDLLFLWRF